MKHNKNDILDLNVVDKKLVWYDGFLKKRTFLILLIPIALFLLWLVNKSAWIAEHIFAENIYKILSRGISFVTGFFPFSLMEWEIKLIPFLVIIVLVFFIIKIIRSNKKEKSRGYVLTLGLTNLICVISIIYFLYVILCGINYHRYPFADFSGLTVQDSSVEELYNMTLSLANEAAEIRTQLVEEGNQVDENGFIKVNQTGWKDVAKTAQESYSKISSEYPVLGGNYKSLKTVYSSNFMSKMEITGIFWPFTMEANVNIAVPEYTIPATMCHELAHLRGFMREDEANFIAYLVCKQSDNLEFQYSGVMLALSYAGNQLYQQDQALFRDIQNTYSTGMVSDLRQQYYYWADFEDTTISTVSSTMNDNYLKANSQDDGVKSYGRMVDLLLAEYRQSLNN